MLIWTLVSSFCNDKSFLNAWWSTPYMQHKHHTCHNHFPMNNIKNSLCIKLYSTVFCKYWIIHWWIDQLFACVFFTISYIIAVICLHYLWGLAHKFAEVDSKSLLGFGCHFKITASHWNRKEIQIWIHCTRSWLAITCVAEYLYYYYFNEILAFDWLTIDG